MGAVFFLFFGEKDTILVNEIAKNHKVPKEIVEKHYKEMLEAINEEVSNKNKD